MKYIMIFLVLAALVLAVAGSGCSSDTRQTSAQTKSKQLYTCPMHPQVISDKPGVCPICHMDLVLKTDNSDSSHVHMEENLDISNNEAILANLKTIKIQKNPLSTDVKAFSTLDFSEENKRTISARFSGRIERLFANQTGTYIRKGDPLFEIYSPELIQAENDYLIGMANGNLLSASEEKLKLLGVTDKEISELAQRKSVKNTMIFYSPYAGTILEKKVQEGMYVNEGTIMYDIADLSTLWNIADVYEADLHNIKPGEKVKIQVQSYPGETFEGKVALVYPVIDPKTRTAKVRSVISNPGFKLKPNMYGESYFQTGVTDGIFIPAESILMTGNRNIVYVQIGKGKFKARDITLGSSYNGSYQVLSGLKDGEEIAYSGGYLIDSESQLRGINDNQHTTHNKGM